MYSPAPPPHTRMHLSFVQGKLYLVVNINLDYVNIKMKVGCIYFDIVVMFYFILFVVENLVACLGNRRGKKKSITRREMIKYYRSVVKYLNPQTAEYHPTPCYPCSTCKFSIHGIYWLTSSLMWNLTIWIEVN